MNNELTKGSSQELEIPKTYLDLRGYVVRETNDYLVLMLPNAIGEALDPDDPLLFEKFVAVDRRRVNPFDGRGCEILCIKKPGAEAPIYETPPPAVMDLVARAYIAARLRGEQPKTCELSYQDALMLSNELTLMLPAKMRERLLGMEVKVRWNQRALPAGTFERILITGPKAIEGPTNKQLA